MRRREAGLRVGVFLLTVVIIVGASATIPLVAQQADEPLSYPEYNASELVPERSGVGGDIEPTAAGDSGLVVIDYAHANRFERTEVQPLVDAITAAGYRVEFVSGGSLEDVLSRADAYVVIDPGRRFSESEVDTVENFVDSGGRVALFGEPTRSEISGFGIRSVTNQMAPLSTRFGIEFGTGYVFNMDRYDGTFQNVFAEPAGYTTPAGDTPVADGIDRSTLYTATHVTAEGGTPVLIGIEGTRSVRSDSPDRYALAAMGKSGQVLAVGDTTFLVRENFNVLDNEVLVANIAEFLVGGERTRGLLDYPYILEGNPTIRYTSNDLLGPAKDIAADARDRGQQPTVAVERDTVPAGETDVLVTTFSHLREHGISGPGTGITLRGERVAVDGYESESEGIVVIRSPRRGIDVVVAANSTIEAEQGVEILLDGRLEQHAISNRTAVVDNS